MFMKKGNNVTFIFLNYYHRFNHHIKINVTANNNLKKKN